MAAAPTSSSLDFPCGAMLRCFAFAGIRDARLKRNDVLLLGRTFRRNRRRRNVCFAAGEGDFRADKATQKLQIDTTDIDMDAHASSVNHQENRNGGRGLIDEPVLAAVAASLGLVGSSVGAIYGRSLLLYKGGDPHNEEMVGMFLLASGFTVAMEYWARWVHKTLWHGCLWNMHMSHHMPRKSFFELNDVFVLTNAVPALIMLTYGLYNEGVLPALAYGAGIGISAYGIVNIFLHDGLIHGRFAVGAIAALPYLRRVVAAHKLHHENRLKGIPFGIYLGPQEVEEAGGLEMMEKLLNQQKLSSDLSAKKK